MRNAVGFYWTLPVPWAGFNTLPDDIDAAAKASRTIRYQCELIRRYARERNYRLVAEKVFLEIAPDRGSQHVFDGLRPLEALCRENDAVFLYVDFWREQGWRGHEALQRWLERTPLESEAIYPEEILIDGKPFAPREHFSTWRARQQEWSEGKEARVARASEAARHLRKEGQSHKTIAKELNDRGFRSASGKPWTEESVRKLLSAAPE